MSYQAPAMVAGDDYQVLEDEVCLLYNQLNNNHLCNQ